MMHILNSNVRNYTEEQAEKKKKFLVLLCAFIVLTLQKAALPHEDSPLSTKQTIISSAYGHGQIRPCSSAP